MVGIRLGLGKERQNGLIDNVEVDRSTPPLGSCRKVILTKVKLWQRRLEDVAVDMEGRFVSEGPQKLSVQIGNRLVRKESAESVTELRQVCEVLAQAPGDLETLAEQRPGVQ
ncbi:MAG: hypothetical protein ACKVZ0_05660 [Gemmatimonadales bacterium]